MSLGIEIIEGCTALDIPDDILESGQPILLKGATANWPAVQEGLKSHKNAAEYILEYDCGQATTAYGGDRSIAGRFFYNEELTGFNFSRSGKTLTQVVAELLRPPEQREFYTFGVGSVSVEQCLPGFSEHNKIDLGSRSSKSLLLASNQTNIPANQQFMATLACPIAGSYSMLLFPPDQIDNIYLGPLDFSPAGFPISLVDNCNPDYDKFPKYREALKHSIRVEVELGDALLIPSMWWRHIETSHNFNAVVNYHWRSSPEYLGLPLTALQHAVLSVRDLKPEQRAIWKHMFDRFVFTSDPDTYQHIPPHARGVLSKVDISTAKRLKTLITRNLNN